VVLVARVVDVAHGATFHQCGLWLHQVRASAAHASVRATPLILVRFLARVVGSFFSRFLVVAAHALRLAFLTLFGYQLFWVTLDDVL